jgi:hypothetical protein
VRARRVVQRVKKQMNVGFTVVTGVDAVGSVWMKIV